MRFIRITQDFRPGVLSQIFPRANLLVSGLTADVPMYVRTRERVPKLAVSSTLEASQNSDQNRSSMRLPAATVTSSYVEELGLAVQFVL